MTQARVGRNVAAVFGLAPQPDGAASLSFDQDRGVAREASRGERRRARPFCVFRESDAIRAASLAKHLGEVAEAAGVDKGLDRATEVAADVAKTDPGLAQHALVIFAAHHPIGRTMAIPSLLKRNATMAARAAAPGQAAVTLGSKSTGDEVKLDWFREDPLANEHHEHWHIVYPNRADKIKERHGELFY